MYILLITLYLNGSIQTLAQVGPFQNPQACMTAQATFLHDHVSLFEPHNEFSGTVNKDQFVTTRCYAVTE